MLTIDTQEVQSGRFLKLAKRKVFIDGHQVSEFIFNVIFTVMCSIRGRRAKIYRAILLDGRQLGDTIARHCRERYRSRTPPAKAVAPKPQKNMKLKKTYYFSPLHCLRVASVEGGRCCTENKSDPNIAESYCTHVTHRGTPCNPQPTNRPTDQPTGQLATCFHLHSLSC